MADYIVNFYNAVRLWSTLGNLSPIAFEHQSAIKKPTKVSEKTWPPHDPELLYQQWQMHVGTGLATVQWTGGTGKIEMEKN